MTKIKKDSSDALILSHATGPSSLDWTPVIEKPIVSNSVTEFSYNSSSVKVVLTMIVKNESRILKRCLESTIGFIDGLVICDTGSTDDTVETITKFAKEQQALDSNFRSHIAIHTWKNFGHNRTASFVETFKQLQIWDWNLSMTYCLFLDADMILRDSNKVSKLILPLFDCYLITQRNHQLDYQNIRLVRASLPWSSISVTHEYWSCSVEHSKTQLQPLWIDDRDDGGSKSDKHTRDMVLLIQGLNEEPKNERYMFYLAQTYHGMCNWRLSKYWYWRRITNDQPSFWEEKWYATYMLGDCYRQLGKWEKAYAMYMQAYEMNSKRAEPLYHIARYYRETKQNNIALFFSQACARIPYPRNQLLFIHQDVYAYRFFEEIHIAAYYTDHKHCGLDACELLIHSPELSEGTRYFAQCNRVWYLETWCHAYPNQVKTTKLQVKTKDERYVPMNPTIRPLTSNDESEDLFEVICRTVNYRIIERGQYDIKDEESKIRTENILLRINSDGKILEQTNITLSTSLPLPKSESKAIGLEDCRFVANATNTKWERCFTNTNWQWSKNTSAGIGWAELIEEKENDNFVVNSIQGLYGPDGDKLQKNWLPFLDGDTVKILYGYEPLQILIPTVETGLCSPIVQHNSRSTSNEGYDALLENQGVHNVPIFSLKDLVPTTLPLPIGIYLGNWRGSAGPIPWISNEVSDPEKHDWLVIIHEVLAPSDGNRKYTHRFVLFTNDFKLRKVSYPFFFLHQGIEYVCGMCWKNSTKTSLMITLGWNDAEAWLIEVSSTFVKEKLHPASWLIDRSRALTL